MHTYRFTFSFLVLVLCGQAFGQKVLLEGNWQGILKQPKGDIIENYAYWINIHKTGDSIKGYARTELANTPYYAIIEFNGIVSGKTIKYTQTEIKSSNDRPNISTWCLIEGDLIFDKANQSLQGTWTSTTPTCGSGSILLYKSLKELNMGKTLINKYENLIELEGKISVREDVRGTKVVLTRVYFDINKSNVDDRSEKELSEVKVFLRKYPAVKINIQGHTDNTGSDDLNMKLSYDRAKEIYNYLLRNKIEKSRMTYEGFGKSRPMVGNETEEDKAKNRRVEIEIIQGP